MAYPVPEVWTVSGTLNKNGVPFYQGKVYADNLKNGEFYQIAETGISADGSFTLTYSRGNFQDGDTTLEFPTLRIRVEDYQGNNLWTSNIYNEPNSALNIGPIDISKLPEQNGDCSVYGTVKNEQGKILSGLIVKAYCLHFEETTSNSVTTRRFKKIELGSKTSDDEGRFVIRYNSTLLPQGLLLDSKEDYGKDKVSLYAEVFKSKENSCESLAIEHLVFNGKTDQEINFFLKAKQESFTCEFEKIDSLLNVYFDAVFSEYGGDDWTKKVSGITTFLNSNTTFPLVAGRERLTESKVYAYFKAYSLYFQLLKRYNTTPPSEQYTNLLSNDEKKYWCEVFYALSLREGISSLYQMIKAKPTVLQKTLLGAISDGLICADTNKFLELWQRLLGEGISSEDKEKDETSLTISQMLLLYLSGNLSVVGPAPLRYVSNISKENISQYLPSDKASLFNNLLDAYYNVGANTDALIRVLQKFVVPDEEEGNIDSSGESTNSSSTGINHLVEYPQLTETQFFRLKTVFDLNDFFEKFADGVVCAYRHAYTKGNFNFKRFADFVKFTESDWSGIVNAIADNYGMQFGTPKTETVDGTPVVTYPQCLPPEFPGTNTELKKVIYVRKLLELIKKWFPQQTLFVDLEKKFGDAIILAERTSITDEATEETVLVEPDGNLINLLENWKSLCLTLQDSDWDEFSLSNSDLDEFLKQNTELSVSEGNQKLIKQLQRLFHLTDSATAIAYLVEEGFDSAYKIASIDEDSFVAQYGGGLGKTEDAKQIHRLAENYIVEATLNIQAYASDSSTESEDTLPSLPRTVSSRMRLAAPKNRNITNTANERTATRDTVNWAKLFGKINYAKATEGQSILSASAYYIDLLKFLKKSSAYKSFVMRRPDYLDLQLTKANAEIPMPTIDLGIELLECLVAGPVENNGFAYPIANNNSSDASAEKLRAEPCPFGETIDVEENGTTVGKKIADLALVKLSESVYPIQLPANFNREKAKKILANLSLHFYDIASIAGADLRELRLDSMQRELISSFPLTEIPTWKLWGLDQTNNRILMPNKVDYVDGGYIDVLCNLSVFLQRSGLTIQDLNVILLDGHFDQVQYKPKDSEYYQLANIDGYHFVARESNFSGWDEFFKKMAVLLHRKNILDWTFEELLLTFDLDINQLDVICEMRARYGVTVQEAYVMGNVGLLSIDVLNEIFHLASPVAGNAVFTQRDVVRIANTGFGMEKDEAIAIYKFVKKDGFDMTAPQIMQEFYRATLLQKTFGLSIDALLILKENGLVVNPEMPGPDNLMNLRKFADEWRIISGTSIDADFYLKMLSPVTEDEETAAETFASNLYSSDFCEEFDVDDDASIPDALDETQQNLRLLVFAEFGIAERFGDALSPENDILDWERFYDDAKGYVFALGIWNKDKENEEKPRLSKQSYALYVNLARKVAVYNYLQNYEQGIDLKTTDFVKYESDEDVLSIIKYDDNGEGSSLKPLVYVNYVTDRLLSGDFNFNSLEERFTTELDDFAEELGLESSDLTALYEYADDAFDNDIEKWLCIAQYYELYSKTHLLPNGLNDLLKESTLESDTEEDFIRYKNDLIAYGAYVENLELAVKSHTKESEWLKFAQEMNDDLRKKKRDALAAYVCWESCSNTERSNRYPRQFVDDSDLYSYYLMDVKMEPDMAISRIVQASASIQLFVQRAELGLEGDRVLNDQQRSEWEWMKNYRVWEAARKVFLYPENWIASDLRDDKTPFFEELEERIQEFSDDHANLENALFEYLEKIREVSSIEIIGATKENGGDEGGILYTLHIVGRTQGEPHTYYYRKYKAKAILSGEWTPWERLDVDIPSETVIPAIVNQRLYLLWPQITVGQRNIESASEGGLEAIEYYARIQVCWTSYTGTKWTGTRMSKNALYDSSRNQLDFALGDNENIEDRYNLKTETSLEWVKVSIVKTSYHYQEFEEIVGSSEVMDGSSKSTKVTKRIYDYTRQFYHRIAEITISADGSDTIEVNPAAEMLMDDCAPERTRLVHGVFKEEEEFTCGDKGFNYPENNAILNYTPGRFRIVSTNLSMLKLDEKDKTEDLPFFYMDGRRTFFVQPVPKDGNVNQGQKNYRFELISHSLVDEFYKRYRDGGTKWLYTRETQALPISDSYYYSYSYYNYYFSVYLGYYMAGDWQSWDLGQNIFRFNYRPDKKGVDGPYPAPMVDFVWGGANAMYNWELFFYVPMLIAEKMIAEQSYEEALLWLQLVFDPRMNYSAYERTKKFARDLPKGARYWKFLPFFVNKDADKSILQMLGLPTKRDMLPDRTALSSLVDKWKNDPFNPHLIARYRKVAYQKYVVMKYLDALIGWGDQEFAKDTTESVNLAIQFYLLAAELLGPKNAEAPEPEPMSALTANDLLSNTDSLGNAFIEYENSALIGRDKAKVLNARAMDAKARRTGNIVESMFYFTVPRNDTLFSYWDTVADRLYKIRNSLNIQGVKRTLALFAPPIDPGMLVKARAMGISIDSILNSSNEPTSIYRFRVIVKLAVDMAKDACQMGRDLLSILEKQDAEQLQVFKAKCDKAVIAESRAVHEMEIKSLEAEKTQLEEKKTAKKSTSKKKKAMHLISTAEKKYQKLMEKVAKIQETVEKVRNIASATFKIPDFKFGAVTNMFGGPRFDMESIGGTKLAENLVSAAESYAARFAQRQLDAAKTKLQAELERRKKEWLVEDEVADAEVVEVEKQEVVNEIKTQQVEKKQKNIENEILRSEEIYDVLSEKFTNNDLYIWLEKELGKVFRQYVNLLIDVAKMAEKAYHFEIPDDADKSYIQSNYWDSFYKGLLAPERILLDLRRMEKAYLEKDVKEMEIARAIRLSEFNKPDGSGALKKLQDEGTCQILLDNQFWTNEFANHSFRRIRNVSVFVETVASVQKVNVELTLLESKLANITDCNPETYASSITNTNPNFIDSRISAEKKHLFEGRGADSIWSLSVTGASGSQITDVIIYLNYTARN
ncbi:hypothetical protein SAMN05720761_12440 [Fibrobacter sp. UWCM]|uniref:Tc toxin subunit A-related protein n=1 Tax=Fibrobacter sp. UWCM TaxID=1896208 RepID=UPI00091DFDCB|nr:neuraminidase-like domain-containing protein [Fibrobacter sp. UWCM]SHH74605.1 hypothetical protein SAMN05720761_12440 [Fibrobacter sp. UWCM]